MTTQISTTLSTVENTSTLRVHAHPCALMGGVFRSSHGARSAPFANTAAAVVDRPDCAVSLGAQVDALASDRSAPYRHGPDAAPNGRHSVWASACSPARTLPPSCGEGAGSLRRPSASWRRTGLRATIGAWQIRRTTWPVNGTRQGLRRCKKERQERNRKKERNKKTKNNKNTSPRRAAWGHLHLHSRIPHLKLCIFRRLSRNQNSRLSSRTFDVPSCQGLCWLHSIARKEGGCRVGRWGAGLLWCYAPPLLPSQW